MKKFYRFHGERLVEIFGFAGTMEVSDWIARMKHCGSSVIHEQWAGKEIEGM